MRYKILRLIGLSICLTFFHSAFFERAIAQETLAPDTLEGLSDKIELIFKESLIPGGSLVLIENNEVILHQHFGVSDLKTGQAVNDDTVFRAGSISKSFTSIAAMMLAEDGALDIGASVSSYLPNLKIDNEWGDSDPVRVVHLLEHTAGFNDITFSQFLLSGAQYSIEDAVELYQPYVSRWKPGTRASYTNSGPILAGRIIEIASETSFEGYTQNSLLSPLGMNRSRWTRTTDIDAFLSKSYASGHDEHQPFVEIPGRPSGSLNTTAMDLAQLPLLMIGRGELNGHVYFTPDTAERIERPMTTDAARAKLEYGYGLGNLADPRGKTVFFGHVGSIDGFAAAYGYSPELGSGYVIMINQAGPELNEISKAIRAYLERDVKRTVPRSIAVNDNLKSRMEGQYKTITPRRSVLKPMNDIGQWDDLYFEDQMLNFRGKRFTHTGDGLFQAIDEAAPSLAFLNDQEGTRLQSELSTYQKVSTGKTIQILVIILLTVATLIFTILHFLVWGIGYFRGKLENRGGVGIRVIPASAFVLAVGAFIAPLIVSGAGGLNIVGTPNVLTWGVYAISILAPLGVGLAFWKSISTKGLKAVRIVGLFQIAIAATICIYLFNNGWFALKLWNA